MKDLFRRFAAASAKALGSVWAFMIACVGVIAWAISGPYFGFSDRWQLVANTVTNVVTILMVFVIQGSQNRDSAAMNIKVDELLRAVSGARTGLIDVNELSDDDLVQLEKELTRLGRRAGVKSIPESSPSAEPKEHS